jgi:hypothetical protein
MLVITHADSPAARAGGGSIGYEEEVGRWACNA